MDTTDQIRRFIEQCAQLEREGGEGPAHADIMRWLVISGQCSLADAIEALDTFDALATAKVNGEITIEQAGELAVQMGTRHATGVAG